MRALHLVKTNDGAAWALWQAAELVKLGVDVQVVLPTKRGKWSQAWEASGATLHFANLDFPVRRPWLLAQECRQLRDLVQRVRPDLIHSHHVGTTMVMRHALGRKDPIPRIFEVPGPLHLEHAIYRRWDIRSAGPKDYWIGTSRCILDHYRAAGIAPEKLFLAYSGIPVETFVDQRTGALRRHLGISDDQIVVGNISYLYAPKLFLGQTKGLKLHEDLIEALSIVTRHREDVVGVLAGGAWNGAHWYEAKLRRQAARATRILMPGYLPHEIVRAAWADFDCVVHAPLSENCGGVLEPLLAGVPTIAGRVGGLGEIVRDRITGTTVPIRNPREMANAILEALNDLPRHREWAKNGQRIARKMFDVRRTAGEVRQVYQHLLDPQKAAPPYFDWSATDLAPHLVSGVLA
jgi:glycosyltransferase involved in cell wall biosynthesis